MSDEHVNQTGSSDVVSDVTIARAVAAAVRGVPAVVDLSPGRFALAATYGSRQRVTGVMVHHPGPHEVGVEVHVILSTGSPTAVLERAASAAEDGLLPAIATQIRATVCRTLQDMSLPTPVGVDVFIDDID